MEAFADELSERLQQEEKLKDENGLSSEGIYLWHSLKLSYNLHWDGNYCMPGKGNLEKKATILREAINSLFYDNREMYDPTDFSVIMDRLILSLNRLNADLGIPCYELPDIKQSRKQSSETRCILWMGDEENMKKLASLLEKNKFIKNADKWLEHFSTSTQESVESGPMQWLQKKYHLQYLLRRLKGIGYIQYPKAYQPHFLVNGKELDGLGGGKHDCHKVKTIDDILKIIY